MTGTFSVIPIEHVQYLSFLTVFLEVTVAQKQSFQTRKVCSGCAKNMISNQQISIKKTTKPTEQKKSQPKQIMAKLKC